MARTVIGISPWPVMKTIGMSILALASSDWKSSPLNPGNRTSSTRQVGASGQFDLQEFGRRGERLHLQADRSEQARQRLAQRSVIVDHERPSVAARLARSSAHSSSRCRAAGKTTRKIEPRGCAGAAESWPACRSTIIRQSAKSQSHPVGLRGDERIEYVRPSALDRSPVRNPRPPRSLYFRREVGCSLAAPGDSLPFACMASIALRTRLMRTSCN